MQIEDQCPSPGHHRQHHWVFVVDLYFVCVCECSWASFSSIGGYGSEPSFSMVHNIIWVGFADANFYPTTATMRVLVAALIAFLCIMSTFERLCRCNTQHITIPHHNESTFVEQRSLLGAPHRKIVMVVFSKNDLTN